MNDATPEDPRKIQRRLDRERREEDSYVRIGDFRLFLKIVVGRVYPSATTATKREHRFMQYLRWLAAEHKKPGRKHRNMEAPEQFIARIRAEGLDGSTFGRLQDAFRWFAEGRLKRRAQTARAAQLKASRLP